MPLHLLTIFEVLKYYQHKPRFNSVYSRNNLSKIKDGAYVINLDEKKSVGTYWIVLFVNDNVAYFDSFGVECIPKEIKKLIANRNITTSIFRIQAYDSIMCEYVCISFINFMLKGKSLLEYSNLFSPSQYGKNGKIKLKFSIDSKKVKMKNMYCIVCGK